VPQLSITYRQVEHDDISALALIRAADWGTVEFWIDRITRYVEGSYNPMQSLAPRIIFTALEGSKPIGFIAGHLTRRYDCDGELQWISIAEEYRGRGIASQLFYGLAGWFADHHVIRVCVNCDTGSDHVAGFFSHHGAVQLNRHWLMWYDIRMHAPLT
jgi:GNAT superfamily N-acetyltransferase